jgi:hypothetical protein
VKSVHPIFGVVVHDLIGNEKWFVRVGSSKSVHRETSRETSDGAEQRFERLGEMMGDEILVYLLMSF